MSSSDPRAIAMHGTIGGIIAKMCGKYYIQGEELGEINKAIVAKIYENKKKIGFSDEDVIAFSRQLGEHLGKALGLGSKLGGEIAEMATRWNELGDEVNLNRLPFVSADIASVGVINYDNSMKYNAGHTSLLVVLKDGKRYEVDYGRSNTTKTGTGSYNGQIKITKRNQDFFDTVDNTRSIYMYKNFKDEHREILHKTLSNTISETSNYGKMMLSDKSNEDERMFDSDNIDYKLLERNCSSFALDIFRNSNIADYTSYLTNSPWSLNKILDNDRLNWQRS